MFVYINDLNVRNYRNLLSVLHGKMSTNISKVYLFAKLFYLLFGVPQGSYPSLKPLLPFFIGCFLYVLAYRDGHLVVYSDTHIDIFNCATGEWVQTVNIKKAKPLNDSGALTICMLNDLAHLLYLSNVHQSE